MQATDQDAAKMQVGRAMHEAGLVARSGAGGRSPPDQSRSPHDLRTGDCGSTQVTRRATIVLDHRRNRMSQFGWATVQSGVSP